jgi:hypothetical protein
MHNDTLHSNDNNFDTTIESSRTYGLVDAVDCELPGLSGEGLIDLERIGPHLGRGVKLVPPVIIITQHV